ncbi:MAG TPA: hypothetical protein VG815_13290, partial [Chloroflexota bacterium]|nr:hypothetical protein [Chloroflexota bacterium]
MKLYGNLAGHLLTLVLREPEPAYVSTSKVTVAADGNSWAGTIMDSNKQSGTTTAARVAGKPPLKIIAGSPTIQYGHSVPVIKPTYKGLQSGQKAPATSPICVVLGESAGTRVR